MKRSGSNRLKKGRPDSGKLANEASSRRSSHDDGGRTRQTEPGTNESAERGNPLTHPISVNKVKAIPHEDVDLEMQPPSSQSTTSSPAKHQAQSDTSPPPVPPKERVNIAPNTATNSQHRINQEENERPGREQRSRDRQVHEEKRHEREPNERERGERREKTIERHAHQEQKLGLEPEGKERAKDARREQQTIEHHAHEEELKREHETKERENEERRKASIEKKKRELQDLNAQVREATARYQALTRTNQKLKEELNGLNSEWHHDLRLLEEQRQVLNASRSFAAREGTLDAATLIQSFNDLNSSIGDFSFEVLRGLDENADTRPLVESDYRGLHETLADSNLKFFVEQISHRELKASDVVDPIVTGIIAADLISVVFKPFAPGLDEDRSNVLKRMYRNMQESEPQERSARWRSITYSHAIANPEADFLHQKANTSVSKVMGVLTALSGGNELKPTKEYFELAHRIFEAAVKVQNRAKTEYVSFDYEVYTVPAKEKYDKLMMDVSQAGNGDPSQVWITIGLGMKARRSILGEGNLLNVEHNIPVKPMVICDNWDHNA